MHVDLEKYRWSTHKLRDATGYLSPKSELSDRALSELVSLCSEPAPATDRLAELVGEWRPHFGVILKGPGYLFAAADKVRSFPIFYSFEPGACRVSNSARLLRDREGLETIDEVGLLEFRMAGYVTRRNTVQRGLRQIRAGELLYFDEDPGKLHLRRYFLFDSDATNHGSEASLREELAEITDTIFDRVVEAADGRTIWVPLSGGLDSRLIVCKLHERRYPAIRTFTYGPTGNHEAKVARQVAERLDLPWQLVSSDRRSTRASFSSSRRRNYWRFADGLSAVPNMHDYVAISTLRDSGVLTADGVIVNGQSGDFISGGHIPEPLAEVGATIDDCITALVEKHFSLWADLKTPGNLEVVTSRIRRSLEELGIGDRPYGAARLWDVWEWEERQVKFVIHGQRVYDFFEIDWELPLWQEEYLRFWRGVPAPLRLRQRLYRDYLEAYDYRGLFGNMDSTIWRWPGWSYLPILGVAKMLQWLGAESVRRDFLSVARYFGHYSYHYQSHPLPWFVRHARHHRNPVSFYAEAWVEETLGRQVRA